MTDRVKSLAVLLFVASTACGGSGGSGGGSGSGSTPAGPTPSADLTGTWDESTGGDLTWQLTQTGTTVTGPGRFSESNGPLGAITGQGTVSGTVSNNVFTFTDNETTVSRPNCTVVATGTLTISSASRMSGRYSVVYSCDGAQAGTGGGTLTMSKR